jgi:hypothetical protein
LETRADASRLVIDRALGTRPALDERKIPNGRTTPMPHAHPEDQLRETTEQLKIKASMQNWIDVLQTSFGDARREATRRIRDLALTFPWVGDLIPDDVWAAVYRTRATGTVPPFPLESVEDPA